MSNNTDALVSPDTKTDTTELQRYKPSNPLGLTEEELALKEVQIKELMMYYPDFPVSVLKMCWDFDYLKTKKNLDL